MVGRKRLNHGKVLESAIDVVRPAVEVLRTADLGNHLKAALVLEINVGYLFCCRT